MLLSSACGKEHQCISQIEDKTPADMSGVTKTMCFYSYRAQNWVSPELTWNISET